MYFWGQGEITTWGVTKISHTCITSYVAQTTLFWENIIEFQLIGSYGPLDIFLSRADLGASTGSIKE